MEPHQQRVIDEKKELDVRLTALSAFINCNQVYSTLHITEQARLKEQHYYMAKLSNVLGRRIDAFTP